MLKSFSIGIIGGVAVATQLHEETGVRRAAALVDGMSFVRSTPRQRQLQDPVRRDRETAIISDNCGGKRAYYHRDAMSPYGFGCQYNHWITFLSISLLEERIPIETGRWTLTCPRVGQGNFWDCFSSAQRSAPPSCDPAHNVYVSRFDKRSDAFKRSQYAKDMCGLNIQDLDEWHLDGDLIRSHSQEFNIDCGVRGHVATSVLGAKTEALEPKETSVFDLAGFDTGSICRGSHRWTPRSNTTFARQMCADAGLPTLDRLQIFRYVARNVVPLQGFEEAKRKCRALWSSKVVLAVHVRRTDKVIHEDQGYKVTEYVDAAVKNGWKFDLVHVVTDDPTAVGQEMHCNVLSMAENGKRFECTTLKRSREDLQKVEGGHSFAGFQGLLEDVACLAEADFLVGSTHSNIPWLAQTLRNKAADTASGLSGEALRMP